MSSVIHYYQHTEGGAVHGFTHPLSPDITKQVQSGELVRVADGDGTDPGEEIARLRAKLARMQELSGIDPSSLDVDGLADTAASSDEPTGDDPVASDEDESLADEAEHVCLECGDPVERKGKTGPWPLRHPECK